jgi:hypothetical protein
VLRHSAGGVISCLYTLEHQAEIAGFICESFAFPIPTQDRLPDTKNIFGVAQSYNGTQSANGVFQALGTWTPATSTPGVVSVSPNSGIGAGPQVFTAVYSDTGGANDLQAVYLNFGSVGFAAHNCIAVLCQAPTHCICSPMTTAMLLGQLLRERAVEVSVTVNVRSPVAVRQPRYRDPI